MKSEAQFKNAKKEANSNRKRKDSLVYNIREVNTVRELFEGSAERYPDRIAFLRHAERKPLKNTETSNSDAANTEAANTEAAKSEAANADSENNSAVNTKAAKAESKAAEKADEFAKKAVEGITYRRAYSDMKALATYLISLGLEGKNIAVTGKNSYEWALGYLAVTCGCGTVLPVDRDIKAGEMRYVLENSDAAAVIYTDDLEAKIAEATAVSPDDGGADSFAALIKIPASGIPSAVEKGAELIGNGDESYKNHIVDPFAMSILLYTSGTTGLAKGVMLSQYNVCSDLMHVLRRVKVTCDDRVVSVLPLHHTYEAIAGFLAMIYSGASIAYNDSIRHLASDLQLFRPTVFIAVPLILENFLKNIMKKYEKVSGGKMIFKFQKLASGMFAKNSTERAQKIFSTVTEAFGGRLHTILCGAALLSPEVFNAYERFGIRVLIGYGLTETAPVCIMHDDFYRDPYDIGYPMVGVEARLCDMNDEGVGELAVRGSNVMLGYYKNKEATEEVLRGGWFYTGDLAKQRENGAYMIVGRKKSMIVTKNGKKIFPEELEKYLSESEYVAECMVFGESGADGADVIVTAAIYPNYESTDKKLAESGVNQMDENYNVKLSELFRVLVKDVNAVLPEYRAIRRVIIRKTEFEKTTTRKIKRFAPGNLTENI